MKSTDAAIADSQSSAANEAAPAKVNLALHILGRCADGYHDIDSLVVFANAGDSIGVRSDGPLALELDGPFAGELAAATSAGDNLVLRAARELASFAKRKAEGLTLTLTKALPVAAGLGGGSADAAATLRLLNRYWRLDASPEDLAEIGSALGADIPMCLRSTPLRATGKGEIIAAVAGMPPLPLVLIFPGVGVSTAAVFGTKQGPSDRTLPPLTGRFVSIEGVADWLGQTRNGLEEPARIKAPVIAETLGTLRAAPRCLIARMSGSGSGCFGLFPTISAARSAARSISATRKDWWVKATTTGASSETR